MFGVCKTSNVNRLVCGSPRLVRRWDFLLVGNLVASILRKQNHQHAKSNRHAPPSPGTEGFDEAMVGSCRVRC